MAVPHFDPTSPTISTNTQRSRRNGLPLIRLVEGDRRPEIDCEYAMPHLSCDSLFHTFSGSNSID